MKSESGENRRQPGEEEKKSVSAKAKTAKAENGIEAGVAKENGSISTKAAYQSGVKRQRHQHRKISAYRQQWRWRRHHRRSGERAGVISNKSKRQHGGNAHIMASSLSV